MFGFWLMWQLSDGFEGMQEGFGMSRTNLYRRIAFLRAVFGEHPDVMKSPDITIDPVHFLSEMGKRQQKALTRTAAASREVCTGVEPGGLGVVASGTSERLFVASAVGMRHPTGPRVPKAELACYRNSQVRPWRPRKKMAFNPAGMTPERALEIAMKVLG